MAKIVGIICEYNPFHLGHKYQIDKIREEMPDAKIVAIMSGNATQRGELTIFEKHKRAESALNMGVDLVLELPFPYSSSCAEIFALGGVQIATGIGCDYLYFGTENAKTSDLYAIADALASEEYDSCLKKHLQNKAVSYLCARQKALFDLGFKETLLSNDILAIEYVRAIRSTKSLIEPRVIKRKGKSYNDSSVGEIMSASGIRAKYYNDGEIISVPNANFDLYCELANGGKVLDLNSFNSLLFHHALITPLTVLSSVFDSSSELASLIKDAAVSSKSADEFLEKLSSKSFTRSRIMRVLLYSIFEVKDIARELSYTRLLGANKSGRQILKNAKKSGLTVITKHSDTRALTNGQREALSLDYSLDMLYLSLLKNGEAPSEAYKKMPMLKNM